MRDRDKLQVVTLIAGSNESAKLLEVVREGIPRTVKQPLDVKPVDIVCDRDSCLDCLLYTSDAADE